MLPWQLCRPVHISWLVAVMCFGMVLGLISATFVSLSMTVFTGLMLAILSLIFGFQKRKVYGIVPILLAGVIIGSLRGGAYRQQLTAYDALVTHAVTVEGVVVDDSDSGKHGEIVLRLGGVQIDDHELAGAIWVSTAEKNVAIKRGDRVIVKGKLTSGFGSFAASMYRAELVRVQRPVPGNIALTLRDWFADGVRRAIPDPEASLGIGYIVGQRRSLPDELDSALRTAGLTHIVVASGYNLTILVGAARRLFVKVSKFLAAFFSGSMVVAFIAVTGMSPSMSRAGLVAGLSLIAWYYGRRFHPVVLLLLAAAATLLIQPAYAQNDLGWQLSFASFAGVLIVGPLLQNYFYGSEPPGVMRQVLFETVCAWFCTAPLIALAFGQFSNVAILANLLVLPLVPLAMLLTFLAGVVTLTFGSLATVVGVPAGLVLGYMTKVTLYLGNVSWAQTEITVTPLALAAYYIALVAVCVYMWRKTQFNFMEQIRLPE